jgi:hypothetical protein
LLPDAIASSATLKILMLRLVQLHLHLSHRTSTQVIGCVLTLLVDSITMHLVSNVSNATLNGQEVCLVNLQAITVRIHMGDMAVVGQQVEVDHLQVFDRETGFVPISLVSSKISLHEPAALDVIRLAPILHSMEAMMDQVGDQVVQV